LKFVVSYPFARKKAKGWGTELLGAANSFLHGRNWPRREGYPHPYSWIQNPCFLEVTDRVALQNIENKGVPCKIFQNKELRAVLASPSLFRLKSGAKRRHRDDDLKDYF
jgi:hypothetical protein